MTAMKSPAARPRIRRDVRRVRRMMNDANVRVFVPRGAQEGGVFRARRGGTDLLSRAAVQDIDTLHAEGTLKLTRTTKAGKLYRAILPRDRVQPPRTARERRNAAWAVAERAFGPSEDKTAPSSVAESPIGWLARRRGADGKPFLSRDEVAAAERLRLDFERSQMAPGVTQDWQRFLTSGVTGGKRLSSQERDLDGGATAARERLSDALEALGPGLSDVALRVCCFLEGIEALKRRCSGPVVPGKSS